MEIAELLRGGPSKAEAPIERFRGLLSLAYRAYAQRRGVGELTAQEAAVLEEGHEWLLKEEARLKAEAAKEGTEYRVFITYQGWWRETAGWESDNPFHIVVMVPKVLEDVLGIHAAAQSVAAEAERIELAALREANLRADVLRRHLAGEGIIWIANRLPADAGIVAKALEAATKLPTFKDTVMATARMKALQLGNRGMDPKAEAKAMERRIKQDLETYQSRIAQRSLAAEIEANDGGTSGGIDLAGTWPGEEREEPAMRTPRFHRDGSMSVEDLLVGKENA